MTPSVTLTVYSPIFFSADAPGTFAVFTVVFFVFSATSGVLSSALS